MATFAMAPSNQASCDMVPMFSGLGRASGAISYWLMQPVSPWLAWFHFTPLTQMSMLPGTLVLSQLPDCTSVEYSPTTWYQLPASMVPHSSASQYAPEPSPALGLKA